MRNRKLLLATVFSGLLTLLRLASGLIISKTVAIYTGPTGIVMLGQVQSLLNAMGGIVSAPAGSGLVRYTAENVGNGFQSCAPWWKATIQWMLFLLLITISLSLIFSESLAKWVLHDSDYYWIIILSALALPLSAANLLLGSVTSGQHQYGRYTTLGIISIVVSSIVLVALTIQLDLKGAMIGAALFTSTSGLVMLFGSFGQPWFRTKYWFGYAKRKHVAGVGSYVAMALTSTIISSLTLLLVRNILIERVGWEKVGQWQAVWKISEVYLGVLSMTLSTYFLPKLSSISDTESVLIEVRNIVRVMMPIVTALAILVYICRDIVIQLAFSSKFQDARDLFALQLVGDIVKIYSLIYVYPMLSRGATTWYIATESMFAICFIGCTMFLSTIYGIEGANLAYIISYAMYFLCARLSLKLHSSARETPTIIDP